MLTFPKTLRLRKSREYDRTMRGGRRQTTANLVIIANHGAEQSARLGLIVSKKVGNAVLRNRVKRCLREAFRQAQLDLPNWDLVVIAKPNARDVPYQTLNRDFHAAIKKLQDSSQLS